MMFRVLRSFKYWMPAWLALGFLSALLWAKARDPFERVEFSLKTTGGGTVKGIAVLPKPTAKHPVVIYVHGSGGRLLTNGKKLRRIAERGLAAVAIEYDQTNQTGFDEQFIALHKYLEKKSWAQTNAAAWVGFSLGAQRTLRFALKRPEFQPQLIVCMAGGWVPELESKHSTSNTQLSASINCPVLFVHGERDEVAPARDCQHLAELLRSHGTPVETRILPQLSHDFGQDHDVVLRAAVEYCATRLPLTDYAEPIAGCELTPVEANRFNLAMCRAGQHRRELWRAVASSREPERHTVMNIIGGLEDYDLAHISGAYLEQVVNQAWRARRKYPWCRDAPLEIFEKFTANPRTYEEPLEKYHFVHRPLPRVKYCRTTADAGNALWAWLSRRVRFRAMPFAPESTPRERINQMGWCVEGVTIYNYFGRSVGLPMRPAYTIWPTVGSSHATHWWSEVWSVEEKQWHAVDSSDYERTYGSFWMLRVPKSTILSTTSERGGWNAIREQRWEAFTNTIALFYPSGQVIVRVLDRGQPVRGQRVVAQTWLGGEVLSIAAARTDDHGQTRLTLGTSARYPYRLLIERSGETDWQWLSVQTDQVYTVTLNLETTKPFDATTEPPLVNSPP